MPGAIIRAFANDIIQSLPVVRGDRLVPVIQIAQNNSYAPTRAGVLNMRQKRERFANAGVRFFLIWPLRKLREPCTARTTSRIEITDDHVIEQDIMKPSRA